MAELISIDPQLITAHAARVDQVASDVALARDAASSMKMGDGAFGILCAFMVPPATIVSEFAKSAIASAERLVERSTRELRGVGTDFSTYEEESVAGINSMNRGFE